MSKNTVYLPPVRLVSFEERIEYIAEELLNLPAEGKGNCMETIRLYHHVEEGIDKRRLLSDPVTGGDPRAPGDEFLAAMSLEMVRDHERVLARIRKRRQRARDEELERTNRDIERFNESWKKRMAKVESFHDPESVRERMAKKEEKTTGVT